LQVARILVDHPRILVTDEATANLDYATEREVKEALNRLSYRPTMLVTAHRYTYGAECRPRSGIWTRVTLWSSVLRSNWQP
jgi:ABC-type bacteriocin/lantibiotic exporter with double-glycine peptidase domain